LPNRFVGDGDANKDSSGVITDSTLLKIIYLGFAS
jgi:hypothetical protein